jgi:hypothetical protein
MIKLLPIAMVLLLTGCVFIGHRQSLSNDPIRFYDSKTGLDIPQVLIVPRYSDDKGVRLGEPFIYRNGCRFALSVPVSAGVLLATTYVGELKSVDGFAVFAKGYSAKWGGYGEEIGEYNPITKESPISRRVGLSPTSDIDSQCVEWLLEVVGQDEIKLDMKHAALFGFGIPYKAKNNISPSGICLIKEWAHERQGGRPDY